MNSIGETLGVRGHDLSPWYKASKALIVKRGGEHLIKGYYRGSVFDMLRTVYSDHDWLPWKFTTLPRSALKDSSALEKALSFVENELKFASPTDWYRVTEDQLRELGVWNLIGQTGGLHSALVTFRGDREWDKTQILRASILSPFSNLPK